MPVGNGMHAETPMHFAGGKRGLLQSYWEIQQWMSGLPLNLHCSLLMTPSYFNSPDEISGEPLSRVTNKIWKAATEQAKALPEKQGFCHRSHHSSIKAVQAELRACVYSPKSTGCGRVDLDIHLAWAHHRVITSIAVCPWHDIPVPAHREAPTNAGTRPLGLHPSAVHAAPVLSTRNQRATWEHFFPANYHLVWTSLKVCGVFLETWRRQAVAQTL